MAREGTACPTPMYHAILRAVLLPCGYEGLLALPARLELAERLRDALGCSNVQHAQAVQVAQEDNSRLLVELAEQLSSLQGAGTAAPGLLASDFAAGAAHGAWRAHAAQQLQHEAQQLECLPAFSGWLQVVVDSAEGLAPGEALAARVACCSCLAAPMADAPLSPYAVAWLGGNAAQQATPNDKTPHGTHGAQLQRTAVAPSTADPSWHQALAVLRVQHPGAVLKLQVRSSVTGSGAAVDVLLSGPSGWGSSLAAMTGQLSDPLVGQISLPLAQLNDAMQQQHAGAAASQLRQSFKQLRMGQQHQQPRHTDPGSDAGHAAARRVHQCGGHLLVPLFGPAPLPDGPVGRRGSASAALLSRKGLRGPTEELIADVRGLVGELEAGEQPVDVMYNPVTQQVQNAGGRRLVGHLRLWVSYDTECIKPCGGTPLLQPAAAATAVATAAKPAAADAAAEGAAPAVQGRTAAAYAQRVSSGSSISLMQEEGGSSTCSSSSMLEAAAAAACPAEQPGQLSRRGSKPGADPLTRRVSDSLRERLSSFKGRLMHHGSYGSLLHGGSSGGGLHVPAAACDDHGAVTAARALVNAVWRLWQVGVQLPEPEACKVAQSGGKVQRSVNGKSRKELHLAGGSTDGNGDRIGTAVCEELGAAGATAAGLQRLLQGLELDDVALFAASPEVAPRHPPARAAAPPLPQQPAHWRLLQRSGRRAGIRAAPLRLAVLDKLLTSWCLDAAHLSAALQLLKPLLAADRAELLTKAETLELQRCTGLVQAVVAAALSSHYATFQSLDEARACIPLLVSLLGSLQHAATATALAAAAEPFLRAAAEARLASLLPLLPGHASAAIAAAVQSGKMPRLSGGGHEMACCPSRSGAMEGQGAHAGSGGGLLGGSGCMGVTAGAAGQPAAAGHSAGLLDMFGFRRSGAGASCDSRPPGPVAEGRAQDGAAAGARRTTSEATTAAAAGTVDGDWHIAAIPSVRIEGLQLHYGPSGEGPAGRQNGTQPCKPDAPQHREHQQQPAAAASAPRGRVTAESATAVVGSPPGKLRLATLLGDWSHKPAAAPQAAAAQPYYSQTPTKALPAAPSSPSPLGRRTAEQQPAATPDQQTAPLSSQQQPASSLAASHGDMVATTAGHDEDEKAALLSEAIAVARMDLARDVALQAVLPAAWSLPLFATHARYAHLAAAARRLLGLGAALLYNEAIQRVQDELLQLHHEMQAAGLAHGSASSGSAGDTPMAAASGLLHAPPLVLLDVAALMEPVLEAWVKRCGHRLFEWVDGTIATELRHPERRWMPLGAANSSAPSTPTTPVGRLPPIAAGSGPSRLSAATGGMSLHAAAEASAGSSSDCLFSFSVVDLFRQLQDLTEEVVQRALGPGTPPSRRSMLGMLLHSILAAAVQRYVSHLESQALVELGAVEAVAVVAPAEVASGRRPRQRRMSAGTVVSPVTSRVNSATQSPRAPSAQPSMGSFTLASIMASASFTSSQPASGAAVDTLGAATDAGKAAAAATIIQAMCVSRPLLVLLNNMQEVLRQQLHLEACLLAGMKGQLLPPSLPPLQAASTLSPVRSQGGRSEGSSSSCSEILDIEDDEDCAAGGPAPSHRDGACSGRRTGAAGSRVEECQKEGWERQLSSQAEALSTQVASTLDGAVVLLDELLHTKCCALLLALLELVPREGHAPAGWHLLDCPQATALLALLYEELDLMRTGAVRLLFRRLLPATWQALTAAVVALALCRSPSHQQPLTKQEVAALRSLLDALQAQFVEEEGLGEAAAAEGASKARLLLRVLGEPTGVVLQRYLEAMEQLQRPQQQQPQSSHACNSSSSSSTGNTSSSSSRLSLLDLVRVLRQRGGDPEAAMFLQMQLRKAGAALMQLLFELSADEQVQVFATCRCSSQHSAAAAAATGAGSTAGTLFLSPHYVVFTDLLGEHHTPGGDDDAFHRSAIAQVSSTLAQAAATPAASWWRPYTGAPAAAAGAGASVAPDTTLLLPLTHVVRMDRTWGPRGSEALALTLADKGSHLLWGFESGVAAMVHQAVRLAVMGSDSHLDRYLRGQGATPGSHCLGLPLGESVLGSCTTSKRSLLRHRRGTLYLCSNMAVFDSEGSGEDDPGSRFIIRYVDIDHLKVEDAFGGTSWLVISYSAASGAMPAGGGGRAERLELGGSDRAHAQQLLSELSLAMARSV